LYHDFSEENPEALLALEAQLRQDGHPPNLNLEPKYFRSTSISSQRARENGASQANDTSSRASENTIFHIPNRNASSDASAQPVPLQSLLTTSESEISDSSKYLAICTTLGGVYKSLTEIDVSGMKSDNELFLAIRDVYTRLRKSRIYRSILFKPVGVEFVRVCTSSYHCL
jgi:hypothetical protein